MTAIFNLPNRLTLFRITLTIFFIIFTLQQEIITTFLGTAAFLAGAVTDYLDGYFARTRNLITPFGEIMDPIADKFLVLSAFFVYAYLAYVTWWMVWIIAAREIGITFWRLVKMKKGEVLPAETWGKYKTAFQMVTIAFIQLYLILEQSKILYEDKMVWLRVHSYALIQALMIIVVLLTVISAVQLCMGKVGHKHA